MTARGLPIQGTLWLLLGLVGAHATGQAPAQETPEQRLQRLSAAVAQVQAQMGAYQAQLLELQKQLAALQSEMSAQNASQSIPSASVVASALEEIRERQGITESQIATHEQAKVETESKYLVRLNGLILFNGFVNTHQVDDPIDPTYALGGSGTTGFSVRQTILGLDANGPHLLGARSHADLNVDFFANGSQATYGASGILRLRTAHADLQWKNTKAFFSLDRSLLAPNVPTSLVATAQPNLSWSGDLWTWNPQVGLTHDLALTGANRLRVQGALIDVQDPLLPNTTSTITATRAERSRWPGLESRIAYASGEPGVGLEIGVGGYFSEHRTNSGYRFDAWAISGDLRLPIGRHFELTSNVYRGAGLGGLGGGGYVDYYYPIGTNDTPHALNDTGGWLQAKIKASERLQFNSGFGIDNPFAANIRNSTVTPGTSYIGLTRNRAAYGNVIVSPSRYLLFSLEYRRLMSDSYGSQTRFSDAIGIAAGYRF